MWPMTTISGALAALAVVAASYGVGRYHGHSAGFEASQEKFESDRAATQKRLTDAANELSMRALEIEAARDAQAELARTIEDEARNDPDGVRPGIGPDGLRRLNRRWGSD